LTGGFTFEYQGPVHVFRPAVAYPLAALGGFVYFLGFPGVNLWPLALVAQAPFLLALHGQTPKRAAGLGLMNGFVISITGFYWLFGMLRTFSGFPAPLCLLLAGLLCLYQGGRTALTGWLFARAERRGWPAPIVFLLAFIAGELVYPLLFPWYFGASAHNAAPLLQTAELGGPYLVGAVLTAPSLALAELLLARLERRRPGRITVIAGIAAPILAAIGGFLRIGQIEARTRAAPAMRVGIAQGNQPLVGRVYSVPAHLRLTKELREKGAELVIWSEGADPDIYPEETLNADAKWEVTGRIGLPAIIGSGTVREGGDRPRYFNLALLSDAQGNVLGRYDKHYLLAFGEYLPFGETFPALYRYSQNSGRFTPGTSLDPLVLGDHRISTFICYEDILPSFVNSMVRHADPDLLVNITNDAWFGDTTEPWEHLALAQLRAVEHRRFLVRATMSGVSAIVDAAGRLTVKSGTFRSEALIGEVRFLRGRTGYEIWGDLPFWALSLAVAAMGFVERRRVFRGRAEKA
jgi:apolipoprotein N-acyltransferase